MGGAPAFDEAGWVAAGLYDPGAPNAAERREVLLYLVEQGATVDEMVEAAALGSLPALAGVLARRSGERCSARDLEREGVVSVAFLDRVWRAAGLPALDPDAPVLSDRDRAAFAAAVAGAEFFGEAATIEFTRAVGAAVAMIADAAMATFGITVAAPMAERRASELEQARAAWDAGRLILDATLPAIDALFLHHVDAAGRRFGESGRGPTAMLAVGFLDLVNSTRMVLEMDAHSLGEAVGRFEQRAVEVVGGHGGRVVKTIGDEVMFVSTDPVTAADAARELATFADEDDAFAGLRGALAWGPTTRGFGDFYGPVVNLAARAVKAAEPGEIVVDDGVAQALADPLAVEPRGEVQLRGFAAPVRLWRLRRHR